MWRRFQAQWVKRPHPLPNGNPDLGEYEDKCAKTCNYAAACDVLPFWQVIRSAWSGSSRTPGNAGEQVPCLTSRRSTRWALMDNTLVRRSGGQESLYTQKGVCKRGNIMTVKATRGAEPTSATLYPAAENIICFIWDWRSTLHLNESDVFYIQSVGASNTTIIITHWFNYQFEQG